MRLLFGVRRQLWLLLTFTFPPFRIVEQVLVLDVIVVSYFNNSHPVQYFVLQTDRVDGVLTMIHPVYILEA